MTKVDNRKALLVRCPKCGAEPGRNCREFLWGSDHRTISRGAPHEERVVLAKAVLGEVAP